MLQCDEDRADWRFFLAFWEPCRSPAGSLTLSHDDDDYYDDDDDDGVIRAEVCATTDRFRSRQSTVRS